MLGSYVCHQCRARLIRRLPPTRIPQWQPRATFLSLRDTQPQESAESARGTEQEADASRASLPEAPLEDSFQSIRPRKTEGRYYVKRLPLGANRASQPAETAGARGHKYLDAIPEGTLNASRGPAQRIDDALKDNDLSRAWELFGAHYTSRDCQALQDPGLSDLELLRDGEIFRRLLNAVNRDFTKKGSNFIVTPTVLLFRFEQLGLARSEFWASHAIPFLTFAVIRAANATSDTAAQDLPLLLYELLSVWRLFFQCKGGSNAPLETISQEWQLPAPESLPEMYSTKEFGGRLQEYHPKYITHPALGFCAVYLYTIADALPPGTLREHAAPFTQFLERLLAGSRVVSVFKFMQFSKAFVSLPEETQIQIKKEIEAAPKTALAKIAATDTNSVDGTGYTIANLEAHYLKRISRAVELKESSGIMDKLWGEIVEVYRRMSDDGKIPARIYNAFLSGYLIVRASQRSVEVWNHMITNQVMPDQQSWVALLEGCAEAQDLTGFNAMWQRMLKTGMEPDNYLWTTRVNGLFSMRQVNQGLAALDEMGTRWVSAESGSRVPQSKNKASLGNKNSKRVNKCTKPSVEVINGAISALVQMRGDSMRQDKRIGFVQKILGWATNFDIKPDVRTYNSLIQLYLRAGDQKTAFKIIRQMEKEGLQSDIATYTMLITASMDSERFKNLSLTEQSDQIISMLSQLENAGHQLNAQVYSIAIDRLLKQSSNMDAVKALAEHMAARNIFPSAHVYTSLITHYFQQSPPAITAVDAITQQVLTSPRAPSDRILFDRIIEGYAAHGEIDKMLAVLKTMVRHSKMPDWNVLTAVLQALAKDGNFELARQMVRDVYSGKGIAANRITGGATGETRFLDAVTRLGIGVEQEIMGETMSSSTSPHRPKQVEESSMKYPMSVAEANQHPAHEYAGVTSDLGYEQRDANSPPSAQSPEHDIQQQEKGEESVHSFLQDELEAVAASDLPLRNGKKMM